MEWIQKGAQLLGILAVLALSGLIKWAADQKSLVAFVAISVVPVIFVLTSVFALWGSHEWGVIAGASIVAGGFIAIATLMITAGQLARGESIKERK